MVEALTSNAYAFHENEVQDFLRDVPKDPRTGKIEYEKYVNTLIGDH